MNTETKDGILNGLFVGIWVFLSLLFASNGYKNLFFFSVAMLAIFFFGTVSDGIDYAEDGSDE